MNIENVLYKFIIIPKDFADCQTCYWGHFLSKSRFYLPTYPGGSANKAFSKVISFWISAEGGPATIKKQLSVIIKTYVLLFFVLSIQAIKYKKKRENRFFVDPSCYHASIRF